jgi:ribose transport system ATP-binding protein
MDGDYILEMRGITKAYPGVVALDNACLGLKAGEVHAIAGENGAGKSTLIKVLSGAVIPDSGTIIYEGAEYASLTPIQSIALGISVIYQELNLIPYLSVAENIFLGSEKTGRLFLDDGKMREAAVGLLDSIGVRLNPNDRVKDLPVAYQQLVEVAKAVSHNAKVLVMDEPTSPLSNSEVETLFLLIDRLRKKGVSIIYISHRMEEIFRICDRVTIMRDGQYVATLEVEKSDRKQLISLMVGRELSEKYPPALVEPGEAVLSVKGLCTRNVSNVSFELYRGEILGLAGLVGAGRTEIAKALFGADRITDGSVALNGENVRISSPSEAIGKGIGLIPEDRKNEGLVLSMPVRSNISLACLDMLTRFGLLSEKNEKKLVQRHIGELSIKASDYDVLVKQLSGGNQQKVVLSKWLSTDCRVLIFDEPTRGIDVGAKLEIYQLMRKLTKKGISIIMISSDMPELLGMSDRILVVHNKTIKACLKKGEFSQEKILDIASGGVAGE